MALFRSVAAATLLLAFAIAPGVAATINSSVVPIDGRDLTIITVEGELAEGDASRFANVALAASDAAIVLLSSPGGNLVAGMDIGRAIHLKGFATAVPEGFQCASACALAWLAGKPRLMGKGATVGFHAAYLGRNGTAPDAVANALVGAYISQLGLSTAAIVYVTEALPAEIRWLTFEDAKKVGIEVAKFELEEETETKPVEAANVSTYWIQIASRRELGEASALASSFQSQFGKGVVVFRYDNGWYVIAIGPYDAPDAARAREILVKTGRIPADSIVNNGTRFVERIVSDNHPPAPTQDRVAKAKEAIDTYFRYWSMPNVDALPLTESLMADEIWYFGRWASKSEVMKEKAQFAARWPSRTYVATSNSLQFDCHSESQCSVTGVVVWKAQSAERNVASAGEATFHVVFSSLSPPKIAGEESNLLRRETSQLNPNPGTDTYYVGDIKAYDTLKMRSGPGTNFEIVTDLPLGTRGIEVSNCRKVAGFSIKWCQIEWGGKSGWASACCLFSDRDGARADRRSR